MKRFTTAQKSLLLRLTDTWTRWDGAPFQGLQIEGLIEMRKRDSCADCGSTLDSCICDSAVVTQTYEVRLSEAGRVAKADLKTRAQRKSLTFLTENEAQEHVTTMKLLMPGSKWKVTQDPNGLWEVANITAVARLKAAAVDGDSGWADEEWG